jgi:hypothetical protein
MDELRPGSAGAGEHRAAQVAANDHRNSQHRTRQVAAPAAWWPAPARTPEAQVSLAEVGAGQPSIDEPSATEQRSMQAGPGQIRTLVVGDVEVRAVQKSSMEVHAVQAGVVEGSGETLEDRARRDPSRGDRACQSAVSPLAPARSAHPGVNRFPMAES